jgi:hypothetical protein
MIVGQRNPSEATKVARDSHKADGPKKHEMFTFLRGCPASWFRHYRGIRSQEENGNFFHSAYLIGSVPRCPAEFLEKKIIKKEGTSTATYGYPPEKWHPRWLWNRMFLLELAIMEVPTSVSERYLIVEETTCCGGAKQPKLITAWPVKSKQQGWGRSVTN